MIKSKILLLSALLCAGTLLGTSCHKDKDDPVVDNTNTEQSDPTNSQNQQGENNPETVSVTSVTLDNTSVSLEVNKTLTLTATVSPDNATDKTVTWSSSDETVATVENGNVTAIKEGEATITAKVGDKTAECKVTVSAPAAKTITVSVDSDDATIKPTFTEDNVTAELKMTISEGTTTLGTLTLQDADGNFSGELTTAPSADGVTLTAIITTTGDATSSTVSITDLMEKCAHTYTGTFAYKTDTKVMLTDDKAYIEIFMSPLQHNIDVTIGSDKQNFAMSDDGKVWIAVDGGTKFTMNFTNEKTTTAGRITTINREGLVDLGLSDGTLWADKNVGATTYDGAGEYYNFNAAQTVVSGNLSVPKGGTASAADNDFAKLKNGCTWTWTNGYNDGSQTGYIVYKQGGSDMSKDAHIFLPAAGYRLGGAVVVLGYFGGYWSSTEYDSGYGFYLGFDSGYVDPDDFVRRDIEFSVRAVRRK